MYDSAKSYLMENVFNNYKKATSSSALNTQDGNVLLQSFAKIFVKWQKILDYQR